MSGYVSTSICPLNDGSVNACGYPVMAVEKTSSPVPVDADDVGSHKVAAIPLYVLV